MSEPYDTADPFGQNLILQADDQRRELESALVTGSTWVERLFLNLLSYSIVLGPIALVVIATRFKLLPRPLLASALIQWFVYGGTNDRRLTSETSEDSKSLLQDDDGPKANGRLAHHHRSPAINRSDSSESESSKSNTFEFLFCLLGLQVSYLIWGLLQEKIMTTKYPVSGPSGVLTDLSQHNTSSIQTVTFKDSQFLVFINRLVAFITAILAFVYTKHRQSQIYSQRYNNPSSVRPNVAETRFSSSPGQKPAAPLYKFVHSSLSNILSSWCQYEALKYVNFPTQCLSKSCKVIPVMLMSKLLMNKRYPYIDYLCALLLALGMFVFMFNQPASELNKHHHHHDQQEAPVNKTTHNQQELDKTGSGSLMASGLAILTLYLTFDSFTSNWQQKLYSRYEISNWQMMAASNFYSIFLTLTSLHQLGNLRPAFELLGSSRVLMRDCFIMSLMSSLGQMFVYYTIKRFGSVMFAVIMTLRQFLSILLSCTIYKHQLNASSTLGLLMVFLVVGFQVWHKSKRNRGAPSKPTPTKRMSNVSMAPLIISSGGIGARSVNLAQPLLAGGVANNAFNPTIKQQPA